MASPITTNINIEGIACARELWTPGSRDMNSGSNSQGSVNSVGNLKHAEKVIVSDTEINLFTQLGIRQGGCKGRFYLGPALTECSLVQKMDMDK